MIFHVLLTFVCCFINPKQTCQFVNFFHYPMQMQLLKIVNYFAPAFGQVYNYIATFYQCKAMLWMRPKRYCEKSSLLCYQKLKLKLWGGNQRTMSSVQFEQYMPRFG